MYRIFKKQLCFEKYLLNVNYRERIALTKFRCCNSKLPVYNQIYMYDTDLCTLCNMKVRGDEFHYLFVCPFFEKERKLYLKPYFIVRPDLLKLEQLINSNNKTTQNRVAKLVTLILKQF